MKEDFLGNQLEGKSTLEVKLEECKHELESKNKQLELVLKQIKSAQDKLEAQEKVATLGAHVAEVVHDIKTPLNSINLLAQGSICLVKELQEEVEHQLPYLEIESFNNITTLLNELLENCLITIEKTKKSSKMVETVLKPQDTTCLEKQLIDFNKLIADSIKLVYHSWQNRINNNIVIETEYDTLIGQIEANQNDTERVFINIIENAFYAVYNRQQVGDTSFSPTVLVQTKDLGKAVQVVVCDNGDGIPQEILEKVFDSRFTTKPAYEGTGLGLFIAREIIEKHGGNILVESEPGTYTKFIVTLPKRWQ